MCAWSQHAAAMRQVVEANANETRDKTQAVFCPSLCVPCADGKRTIFISRSKGVLKTAFDLLVAPVAVVGAIVFHPVALALAPAYLAAEKAFAGSVGNECPDMEIAYFEAGGVHHMPADQLQSLMSKDDYLSRFKKNLNKLWLFDYVSEKTGSPPATWDKVKNAVAPQRPKGELPAILASYMRNSAMFCEENGEDLGEALEESWWEGVRGHWKPFWNRCEAFSKELAEAQ